MKSEPTRQLHIAVSLSGEGTGHTTRISALGREIRARHRISVWCAEHTARLLRPALPGCTFHYLPFLKNIYRRNRVDYFQTLAANSWLFYRSRRLISALGRRLRRNGVDAIVCDYEPLLGRAGLEAGIPVVLFNHQGSVDRNRSWRFSWLVAWGTNRAIMPRGIRNIVSSFYDGDVGPLIRPEVTSKVPTLGDFVFVYAREGFKDHVLPLLSRFPDVKFRVFPSNDFSFSGSLASCRGVISPAGHQLMSETLHLRKPSLVFPQRGQYEQDLNARMLERSGWGLTGDFHRMDDSIRRFLERLDDFPLREPDPAVRFCLQDDTPHAVRLVEHFLHSACGARPGTRNS